MKKLAAIATGLLSFGYLGAFEMPAFGLDAEVKYSSEHVDRGYKKGSSVFVPKVEVNVPVFEKGKIYVGTWAVLGIDGNYAQTKNEVSPYLGLTYDVTDMFTLDVGYIHHLYTNIPTTISDIPSELKRNTSEVYMGVMADILLSPSLYIYYDFDAEEVAIEGKVAYSFDFAQFGVNGVSLDLSAKLGYDSAEKPNASKYKIKDQAENDPDLSKRKDFLYYGLSADLVYSFNERARARAGIAYEGNAGTKHSWQNSRGEHKSLVFFNASVDCSF